MKRTLSLLVVLALVFTMIPAAFATDNKDSIEMDELVPGTQLNPEPAEIGQPYEARWDEHYYIITPAEAGNLELTVENGTIAMQDVEAVEGKYAVKAETTYTIVVTGAGATWTAVFEVPHVHAVATYTDNGDGTHDGICECKEVVVDNEAHEFVDGFCACGAEEEEEPIVLWDIDGTNIQMGNNLNLLFLIRQDKHPEVSQEGYSATATITHADSRGTEVREIPASDWIELNMGSSKTPIWCWCVPVGFAAKEMGEEATVIIYKDGVQVSNPKTQSFLGYCQSQLGKSTNAKFKTVIVDMLNYGAAAQTHFKYNPNVLVNKDLTEAQKQLATKEQAYTLNMVRSDIAGSQGRYKFGPTIVFENEIFLQVQTQTSSGDAPITKGKLTFTNHYKQKVEVELDIIKLPGSSYYGFNFPGLVVADMNQPLSIEFYTAESDEPFYTMGYSLNAYLKNVAEKSTFSTTMKALGTAFAKFSTSAYAYFH